MSRRTVRFGAFAMAVILASSLAAPASQAAGSAGAVAGMAASARQLTAPLSQAWQWFTKALAGLALPGAGSNPAVSGRNGRGGRQSRTLPGGRTQPPEPIIRIQCDQGMHPDPNGNCVPG